MRVTLSWTLQRTKARLRNKSKEKHDGSYQRVSGQSGRWGHQAKKLTWVEPSSSDLGAVVAFCIRHLRLCSTPYNFEFSEVCHVHFILFLFFFFPFKNSKNCSFVVWLEGGKHKNRGVHQELHRGFLLASTLIWDNRARCNRSREPCGLQTWQAKQ